MQSVLAISEAIENGRMRPEEAVAACFGAIARREDEVKAFAALAERDAALAQAREAKGPLAGIAVGVKDIFDTCDLPTAYGSPIFAGLIPRVDAALVAMLRAAGAAVIGKTVTTEYAYFHPGKTRNPHDLTRTPGGSSSGSAAAVAAGMVPAAIGTQTGGSIIRPAAFCGVAGYKPSFGIVPATGMKTFAWSLDTPGFFAATVADLAAFAAAVTGRPLEARPLSGRDLRIGLYRTAIWNEASGDMRAAVDRMADRASNADAHVVEIDEPAALAKAREAHAVVQNYEAGRALAGDLQLFGDQMSGTLRKTIEDGLSIRPERYDEACEAARQAQRSAAVLFNEVDVLITPSATGAAPEGLQSTGSPVFNKLWTLTGSPCVNVPGLRDSADLPLGVQIVARFGNDAMALSAAAWLQELALTERQTARFVNTK